MSRTSIKIGTLEFKTQKLADEYVRSLLSGNIGKRIDSGHLYFGSLMHLIKRHPEAEEKIGAGVAAFLVRPNPFNSEALAFDIERIDGSKIDISWKKCVTGRAVAPEKNLRAAMRHAVKPQIRQFREGAALVCEMCGSPCSEDSHVDHIEPFEKLVMEFLAGRTDTPTEFDDDPFTFVAVFKESNSAFEVAWKDFHGNNATLRLTCPRCNLTRSRL